MKRFFLPVLLVLISQFSSANAVLTLAGSSAIQSGVPFSLDVTFSNVPTTLGITFVKLSYFVTVSPTCVPSSSFNAIGGTYWGNGVGSNPPLINVIPGAGALFPLSTNMLPMYTGMSANAILNVVTNNGSIPNGTIFTINAVATYYTSASSTSPVLTETTNTVTVSVIASNLITANLTSPTAGISLGNFKIYELVIQSPYSTGGLDLYATSQNVSFNFPSCASVFNVYDGWTTIPSSVVSPGLLKFTSSNITGGGYKVYHVVLTFPCPAVAPCVVGSNVSTSYTISGLDICGNFLSTSSSTNNCLIVSPCSSSPPVTMPPVIIPTTGSSGGGGIGPGGCSVNNMLEIQNMTTTTYNNSSFQYTMPNTTNILGISFNPAIPSSTNIQISYSGIGCPASPFTSSITGPIINYSPPASVNVVAPTCTTKTISMNFPPPLIAPFSNQKIYFNYSVSATAPTTGVASFPFVFNSSSLASPISIPSTIPYVPLVPHVGLSSEIFTGTNCVNSNYYNPGQLLLIRLRVDQYNIAAISNLVLNDVLHPNLSFNPAYGVKLCVGNTLACIGLPFVNAPMTPSGSSYTTGLVSVSGVGITSSFNTLSNTFSLSCPSLMGAFSCTNPQFLYIEFQVRVKPGTPVGSYPNQFSITGTNINPTYSGSAFVIVNSYFELTLRMKAKRDNGIYADNLTTCVCQSSLNPNANKITYRGELINTGNVAIKNISFFNMKPKAGDLTFPACATSSRGTSALVNGLTCYNNPFNMTNNAYSLVPFNYPNPNESGFKYSGGYIPSGSIGVEYYGSGSPYFNAPQLPFCAPCPSCTPITTSTSPVHFGTAKYTFNNTPSSPGVILEAGQTLSFFTNPVCLQKLPTGTQLVNDFFVQGYRQDLNINTPILKSNDCVVTINTSSCPNTSCDSSIVKKIVLTNEYGRYYFRIWNQSGTAVNKVKVEIFPGGCFTSYYSYTQILATPLAPWAFIDIVNSTAGFPPLPTGPCTVNYKTTLYSLTTSGVPATYDSCSRSANWVQYPARLNGSSSVTDDHAEEILLYPVPAGNFLILNTEAYLKNESIENPNFDFSVFDISGHLVLKYNCSKALEEIDIHNLAPGMYFYKLMNGDEVISRSMFSKE